MCSVDCSPNCQSPLARACLQTCPAMCFEAGDYIVNTSDCKACDWLRCWPVLSCIANDARIDVLNGSLSRTCHEPAFHQLPQLQSYWQCWFYAPKHSSHWNTLSSIISCICREGMRNATRDTHCCNSAVYGGGTCDLECRSEAQCVTQEAQTCIHNCSLICHAFQHTPSAECFARCLARDAPCRQYVSCRPPVISGLVCDSGDQPEANSGCCVDNVTGFLGCPKLCDSQRVWRVDGGYRPWWARQYPSGAVTQCSCAGCPSGLQDAQFKLERTVNGDIWHNGQMLLIDIARQEGLKYGANRKMQELVAERNLAIRNAIRDEPTHTERVAEVAEINEQYIALIRSAALAYPDLPNDERKEESDSSNFGPIIVIIACASAIIVASFFASLVIRIRRKQLQTPVNAFDRGFSIVVGQPAPIELVASNSVFGGTPVIAADLSIKDT